MRGNMKNLRTFMTGSAIAACLAAVPLAAVSAHPGGGGMGGQSMSHMSGQGFSNTNGPNAADRDFGFDRAQDRMSTSGARHGRASSHTHSHTHGHSTSTLR